MNIKKATNEVNTNTTFTGQYTRDIFDVTIASAVTGQHSMIIGLPGWGKTTMTKAILDRMLGRDRFVFVRLDPTTPAEVVRGAYNPLDMMRALEADDDGDRKLTRVTDGTPYDPTAEAFLLDEIGRASPPVFDILIDTLDRQDLADDERQGFAIATSNFAPDGERTDALIDRFTNFLWLQPEELDPRAVGASHMVGKKPTIPFDVPTWSTVEAVRAAVPGQNAIDAVATFVDDLIEAAVAQGYEVNPRRISQWYNLLYRVGVLYTADADFAELPIEAARIMRFAWPTRNEGEAQKWAEVVGEIVDVVGAAVEEAIQIAVIEFQRIAGMDDLTRSENLVALGEFLTIQQEGLRKLGSGVQIEDACQTLARYYSLACQGIDPLSR